MWKQKPRKSFLNGKEVDMNKSTTQNKAPPFYLMLRLKQKILTIKIKK